MGRQKLEIFVPTSKFQTNNFQINNFKKITEVNEALEVGFSDTGAFSHNIDKTQTRHGTTRHDTTRRGQDKNKARIKQAQEGGAVVGRGVGVQVTTPL